MASADRLIALLNEAKARPTGVERERFLVEACRDDPELKEQVISLLQAHEGAGDFLKNTIAVPTIFVPPDPSELAKHFPQLEIIGLIGQGGMGVVYRARQRQLDRMVALKILLPEPGRDSSFAERFIREARALARLNHPNIVSVYDFGQSEGLYYFLMEFVDGVNLRQLEQSRRLTPPEALTIIPKICEALQYAHDEGIVHRDIKPGNILVDKRGRVKIADFGLAKLLGKQATDFALTGSQQVMGTPHYMAPEQMEKPQTVDHRADIYSLGVVFYEMLTGELPIGRFALPSHKVQMDVRLDEVVLKSLEKEPDRRYQHASEVKRDVESIDSSRSGPAPSGTVGSPATGESAAKPVVQQVRSPAIGLSATDRALKEEPTEGKTLAKTTLEKSEAESSAPKPKPPVSSPILVSIVAAVLLLAVGSYLLISHLAGERYGSIEITSAPTGAEVSLNGQKVGPTPYRDSKIVPGELNYLLKLEGYSDQSNKTNITAKAKAKLHIVLSRQTGTVDLRSDPSGAQILTNGIVIGKTPSTLTLFTGPHTLTLRYPGLKEQKVVIPVENQQTKLHLVEFPRGAVRVMSDPSGATVLLGGRPMGKTPAELLVDPGLVDFELQLDGYNNAIVRTNVTNKGNVIVSVILLEGQGRVAIRSETVETITNSVGMILIKVRDDLWIGQSKVTVAQYQTISGAPGLRTGQPAKPAEMSWIDAMTFCTMLASEELGIGKLPSGLSYSLPKPGEWEEIAKIRGLSNALAAGEAGLNADGEAGEWCFTTKGTLKKRAPTIVVTNPGTGELKPVLGKELDKDSEGRTFRCVLAPPRDNN